MGRKTIEPFIYDGILEWYLRIPLRQPKGQRAIGYDRQYFYTEYLSKQKYTMKQTLERRLELVIQFENEGKRRKTQYKNRLCDSAKFIQEEKDGLYDKYDNW